MLTNKAYFLIETAIGKSREVSLALQTCGWVEYVERVAGPYDVVGVAQADELQEIAELINDDVKTIDGVIRVVVCPISGVMEMGVPAEFAAVGQLFTSGHSEQCSLSGCMVPRYIAGWGVRVIPPFKVNPPPGSDRALLAMLPAVLDSPLNS